MPPTNPTPLWRLANKQVKGGIDAFLSTRRAANLSWYDIALDLYLETKGDIKVTPETVRSWFVPKGEAA